MDGKSMTALMSAFSRAYHSESYEVCVFRDSLARSIVGDADYEAIGKSLADGKDFFCPGFQGTPAQVLRRVVDAQISPAVLGRAAFAEKSLERAVGIGAGQYLVFGAGYDTFALRQPCWARRLEIFEMDLAPTACDMRERVRRAGLSAPDNVHFIDADFSKVKWENALISHKAFDAQKLCFCTLLGVTYYLSQQTFSDMLSVISGFVPKGSTLVFDYPDEDSYTEKAGIRARKQYALAGGAKEKMLASYSYEQMESLLASCGFLIYEHLDAKEMTEQYFAAHNAANPGYEMTAFDNTNYCLAVKG